MSIVEHDFTKEIYNILQRIYSCDAQELMNRSPLLQYLNIKTKAANRGSKSRAGFANHYAIYVLIEDYLIRNLILQEVMGNMKVRNSQSYLGVKENCLLVINYKIML